MPSIRSSKVVVGDELRPATIRYEEGTIVGVEDGPAEADYGDLIIIPGLVDTHVHVNEPGRTEWEGFMSATAAAAAGGTTTIVDMPLNSIPPTTDVGALAAKRSAAEGQLAVDVGFWGGVIPGSAGQIPNLVEQGVGGFKMFMIDSGVDEFPLLQQPEIDTALTTIASLRVPALVHAESARHLEPIAEPLSYRSYLASRPALSEAEAVASMATLAGQTGANVHILHVSSADAVSLIAASPLSGETCPHYLTFDALEIPDRATQFKCAPPIRGREHREALWEGLGSGALTMVVSDHSPAPASLKKLETGDFSKAWGGISSLQLRLPATWTGAVARGFGPVDVAAWLARSPARLAGLSGAKGTIEVGKDADFVVFDPNGEWVVRGSQLLHRHPVTPYEGMRLRGAVVETYLGGDRIFDGAVRHGRGRMLRRHD